MHKVLIISYFSPPCNLTASGRIGSWKDYLAESDIYPIIVTRNWTGLELNEYQRLEKSDTSKFLKEEKSEVHYLEYKSNLRDRLFIKSEKLRFYKILSRFFTLINLIFRNFSLKFIPYNNFYYKAVEILTKDDTIETVLISGNPFEQFYFGYLLKKKFPHINWIADYRDDWTTSELTPTKSLLQRIILNLEKKSEKKWLSNATTFTSVSPFYVDKISGLINKKGHVVFNGYNEELIKLQSIKNKGKYTITYNGSLYSTQKIETFLEAYKLFINKYAQSFEIKIYFPGLGYDKTQSHRVKKILKGYEQYYSITDRVPKQDVINIQLKSDLLLMVAHDNIKGIPSSKIFEYIGLRKPILLCPSDHDVLKQIVSSLNHGFIAEDKDACFNYLCNSIENTSPILMSTEETEHFSSIHQVKKMASIIHNLR